MSEHPNFGYEQEYLLWGDPDGQVDVATSILGFTGFGVPILQSIILLAWSLAESYLDMTQLMN